MKRLLALVMVVSWFSLVRSPLAVEIIAHRGASHDAPENTVAALRLGWEQNADAGELDVRLTKDGQIVVIHDNDTKRTTGVAGAVAQRTLAELRSLDAGRWKGPEWTRERLPTLSEALATVPDGKRMFIEIKCGPEILPQLEPVLKASGRRSEQLAIIGFNYTVVKQAKQRFPQSPVYWIVSYKADKKTGKHPDIRTLIAKARAARLDGLDLDGGFPLDAACVAQIKTAGLGIYVWTVDDAARAGALAAAGVDGITTNRPAWLREQLQRGSVGQ